MSSTLKGPTTPPSALLGLSDVSCCYCSEILFKPVTTECGVGFFESPFSQSFPRTKLLTLTLFFSLVLAQFLSTLVSFSSFLFSSVFLQSTKKCLKFYSLDFLLTKSSSCPMCKKKIPKKEYSVNAMFEKIVERSFPERLLLFFLFSFLSFLRSFVRSFVRSFNLFPVLLSIKIRRQVGRDEILPLTVKNKAKAKKKKKPKQN